MFGNTYDTKTKLLIQLLLSLLVLAFVKNTIIKLVSFLVCWNFTGLNMLQFSKTEWLFCLLITCCMAILNFNALSIGIFMFDSQDMLLQPYWEFVMWPFYILHTRRVLTSILSSSPSKDTVLQTKSDMIILAVATLSMSLLFGVIRDDTLLFVCSSLLLVLILFKYHTKHDIAHVLYMQILGYIIETTGVWGGEWSYPSPSAIGVPLWFLTMWGSIGFFSRRLVYPLACKCVEYMQKKNYSSRGPEVVFSQMLKKLYRD